MEFGPILLLRTAEGLVACDFSADAHEQLSKGRPKRAQYRTNPGHGEQVHSVHIVNTEKVVDDTSPMRSFLSSWNIGSATGIWCRNGST